MFNALFVTPNPDLSSLARSLYPFPYRKIPDESVSSKNETRNTLVMADTLRSLTIKNKSRSWPNCDFPTSIGEDTAYHKIEKSVRVDTFAKVT